MNILIPHSWLLDHLETDASPEEIQRIVSLSGPSIERIYDKDGEKVYDIEVTTNRVDAMSVRGIAREAAVILNHAEVKAKLKNLSLANVETQILNQVQDDSRLPMPKITNNPVLCPRILCVVLKDVQRTPTPEWMAKRLTDVEISVHDAVIDITNYITHELGHPCHAFDYDKIMATGGQIIVKEAEKRKKFVTLDGVEYETKGGEIVFENEQGEIIDLPGIKGTQNTAIDDTTKNVLFWMESIAPKKVRQTSMSHAIRTTAAQLNEKRVDPELMMDVLLRGIELYQQICHAEVASEIFDEYPGKKEPISLEVQKDTIDKYLGIELASDKIVGILEELGCHVETSDISLQASEQDSTAKLTTENRRLMTYNITPPSFRPDLRIPADIVEEVARIYGYHNLPSVLMDTAIPLTKPEGAHFKLEEKIKHFLSDIGWQEVYTYSFVSEKLAIESGWPLEEHLKLQNPLTDDKVYLRNSLIPSLSEVIDTNPTEKELSVFEIAHVYWKQSSVVSNQSSDVEQTRLPEEIMTLAMVSNRPLREVKGDLEALMERLHISLTQPRLNDPQMSNIIQSSVIQTELDGKTVELGTLAVLKNGRTAINLGINNLSWVAKNHPKYHPIPQTAQIVEDLTFTLPERTATGPVIAAIHSMSPLIVQVELKDQYKQNATFSITYLDPTKNLSSNDIEPIRAKIAKHLNLTFQAELVGKLS